MLLYICYPLTFVSFPPKNEGGVEEESLMNNATLTKLNDWTIFGVDRNELSGYQQSALMAAIHYNQVHPEYVKRLFKFDGRVIVNHDKHEIHLNPIVIHDWRLLGGIEPSRIQTKKFLELLSSKKDNFDGADLRRIFGHVICTINRNEKVITFWRASSNIGMGDSTYPILDEELSHITAETPQRIYKRVGSFFRIDEDSKRLYDVI